MNTIVVLFAVFSVIASCFFAIFLIRRRRIQEDLFDRAPTQKLSGKNYPLPLRMANTLREKARGRRSNDTE